MPRRNGATANDNRRQITQSDYAVTKIDTGAKKNTNSRNQITIFKVQKPKQPFDKLMAMEAVTLYFAF